MGRSRRGLAVSAVYRSTISAVSVAVLTAGLLLVAPVSAGAAVGPGTVIAWGSSVYGQSDVPAGLSGVVGVSDGYSHSLALKSDGTVVAWGNDALGQTNVPAGLSGVVAVSAGDEYNLALKSDGTVVAWGYDLYGQTDVPAGLSGVVGVSAGTDNSLAVKSDGTVVAWGDNWEGQSTVPSGLSGVVAVSAGGDFSLALKSDGTVVAWGSNSGDQATPPAGLSGVVGVSAGGDDSLAVKSDGTVVAWGNPDDDQTVVPAGLSGVIAVAAGQNHSLALKSDGTVVAWGNNSQAESTVPPGLSDVDAISAGAYHSLAITQAVKAAFTTDTPPTAGSVGTAYPGYKFTATGTPAPTYAVVRGLLPVGLTLDPVTGWLSGIPLHAGTYAFNIAAVNGVNPSAWSNTITITVAQAGQTVTITSVPPAPETVRANYPVTVTGGASGNPIIISTGTPLVCVATGPTVTFIAAGTCVVNADQAGDCDYTAGSATQTITVDQAPRFTTARTLPAGKVSKPFHIRINDIGTPAPTATQTGGKLPPGLTLTADDVLAGTPTRAGVYRFTLTASNPVGATTRTFTSTIRRAAHTPR